MPAPQYANSGELSYLVDEKSIETLPLNGRNFTDLALLQPGVLPYPSRDGGSVVAHGMAMSVNGQDYRSNVYLLDGTLQNDFTNGPAGSAAGTALGMETIREFRVESNAYSAEFGRNYGGQINVLTKSGANRTHRIALRVPPQRRARCRQLLRHRGQTRFHEESVRRHAGGPLRRDRLFYFVGYEGLRESLGKTITSFVPDNDARAGRLPDGPVAINAAVQPYLDAYPVANGRRLGGGLATYTFGFPQKLREHFGQGRLDYNSIRATSSSRATRSTTATSGCRPTTRSSRASFLSRNQFFTGEYRNILSDRTLQTMRARLQPHPGRPERRSHAAAVAPFVPGRGLVGDIDVGGLQRFGPQSSGESPAGPERLQLPDDVTQCADAIC